MDVIRTAAGIPSNTALSKSSDMQLRTNPPMFPLHLFCLRSVPSFLQHSLCPMKCIAMITTELSLTTSQPTKNPTTEDMEEGPLGDGTLGSVPLREGVRWVFAFLMPFLCAFRV